MQNIYVTKRSYKDLKNTVRELFPQFQFIFRLRNCNSLEITIVAGDVSPVNGFGNNKIDPFFLRRDWTFNPPAYKFLDKLISFILDWKRKNIVSNGLMAQYYFDYSIQFAKNYEWKN